MSFSALGLSDALLRALQETGYTTPTPIQQKAIPAGLAGRDVMAEAQTGTGKTAAFTLPLLQRLAGGAKVKANHIRALVLVPTRELAVQVADSVSVYGKYLSLKSAAVYGGVKINPQMMKLRGGIDVLVATPGRLLDLSSQNAVKFSQLETLVLDEADRMLDMGFLADIRRILALLPRKRQNMLFSATLSSDIRALTDDLLHRPVLLHINPPSSAAKSIKQYVIEADKNRKPALLSHLIRNNGWEQVLVFVRTRDGADRLVKRLNQDGIAVAAIHGDKSQGERSRALSDFKEATIRVLVATDVASRGIDISELPHVINLDLPKVPEDYIHRIGRTGRAGSEGVAISLVSADEVPLLAAIESLTRQTLTREIETGFVPTHSVPLTRQTKMKPKKPKKPKLVAVARVETTVEGWESGSKPKGGGARSQRGGKSQDTSPAKDVPGKGGNPRRRRGR